jgi:hypothetical protein
MVAEEAAAFVNQAPALAGRELGPALLRLPRRLDRDVDIAGSALGRIGNMLLCRGASAPSISSLFERVRANARGSRTGSSRFCSIASSGWYEAAFATPIRGYTHPDERRHPCRTNPFCRCRGAS